MEQRQYLCIDQKSFYATIECVARGLDPMKADLVVADPERSENTICLAVSVHAKKRGIQNRCRIKDIPAGMNVIVAKPRMQLYIDCSAAIYGVFLKYLAPEDIYVYSIDEAFLDLSGMGNADTLTNYCKSMVKDITKGTGIPISLGIAPTKTLAKMASKFAKKHKGYEGVCLIDSDEKREKALRLFPIEDVWGIGRRHAKKLAYHGIHTAWDLTQRSESWIRRELTVTGVHTWKELMGESCISIEELPHKKSICTSRSFPGIGLDRLRDVEEAVANFAASCSRKLREAHTACSSITVFAYTSRFRMDVPQHCIYRSVNFTVPTNDIREIISAAVKILQEDWKEGFHYKKAGVIVWNICEDRAIQSNLFDCINRAKQSALAKAVDEVNRKNGHDTIRMAVQGYGENWKLRNEYVSKQYTTNIRDVIIAKAK